MRGREEMEGEGGGGWGEGGSGMNFLPGSKYLLRGS